MNINFKILLSCATLVLAGCAASAAPVQHAAPLSASEQGVLRGAIAQYDRQIAALRATFGAPAFQNTASNVDAAVAALKRDVAADSSRANSLIAQKAAAYAAREDDAVSAVLAAASASAPSRADVQQRLQSDYRSEYAQLRNGAQGDMAAYEHALLAQQQRAYATFVRAIQERTTQAYQYRAAELNEKESALLLELARRDAPTRLQLRAKQGTLALDSSQTAAIRAQLAAMQARENRAAAQAQAADARVLSAYRERLLTQANSDVAAMSARLTLRTQANLAQRRDVLAAQKGTPASLPLGSSPREASGVNADLRSRVTAMRASGAQAFRDDAAATVAAYSAAGNDIAARFSEIRQTDSAADASTKAEIAQLERDRDALAARLPR